MPKIYYEEDEIGKHKVIEQDNGIKIRLLKEPSEWYKEKQKKNKEKEAGQRAAEKENGEREKLIRERIREMAIDQLKSEGKIK